MLLLVNGPPGIGKSNIAARYIEDHPLTLLVEIDAIRSSLGQWQVHEETKLIARRLAVALMEAHLRDGHDVIVPQFLGRTAFIAELDEVANRSDAELVEAMLSADRSAVTGRFTARRSAFRDAGTFHPEAGLADVSVDAAIAGSMALLDAVRIERPDTRLVSAEAGVDETYAALLVALDDPACWAVGQRGRDR